MSNQSTNSDVRFFISKVESLDKIGMANLVFPADARIIVGEKMFERAAAHPNGRVGKRELKAGDSVLAWIPSHDEAKFRYPGVKRHGLAFPQECLDDTLATIVATRLAAGDQASGFLVGLYGLVYRALFNNTCFPDQGRQTNALANSKAKEFAEAEFYLGTIEKWWTGDHCGEAHLTTAFSADGGKTSHNTAIVRPQGCFARRHELKNVVEDVLKAAAGKGRYPMIIGFDPMVDGADAVLYDWGFAVPTKDLRVPCMILVATFLAQENPSDFLRAVYEYIAQPLFDGDIDPEYGKKKGDKTGGNGRDVQINVIAPTAIPQPVSVFVEPELEQAFVPDPGFQIQVQFAGTAPTKAPEAVAEVDLGTITELEGLPEVFEALAVKTFGEVYARSQDRDVAIAATLATLKEEGVKPGKKAGTWTLSAAAKKSVAEAEKVKA
ncbi:MAG: hypothetical protein AAB486_00185 [Patescibacteria group bacterium]